MEIGMHKYVLKIKMANKSIVEKWKYVYFYIR